MSLIEQSLVSLVCLAGLMWAIITLCNLSDKHLVRDERARLIRRHRQVRRLRKERFR
jgi:hypothetical protein